MLNIRWNYVAYNSVPETGFPMLHICTWKCYGNLLKYCLELGPADPYGLLNLWDRTSLKRLLNQKC